MTKNNTHYIAVLIYILLFLILGVHPSYAVLSMSEVEYLFEQEKGHSWDEATAQEKKNFIQEVRGREEGQEGIVKEKEGDGDSSGARRPSTIFDGREEKTPYKIRASFEAERGIEWEEATEDEQRDFQRTFEMNEKIFNKNEKMRLKLEEIDEKRRRNELKLKKRQLELRRKLRLQEEKRIRAELKRKREEEERKLEMKKKEIERLREESKRRHQR